MRPLVSIVMPVYNAEDTLPRMVNSIKLQTLSNWELIAVDDGSKDRSGLILDEYAAGDARIKVIHKQNKGVASARQSGVAACTGTYIIHADADDWVEPEMLADMIEKAKQENADIVITDYFVESPSGDITRKIQKPTSLAPMDVLYEIYARDLFGGLCHKLMQASVYDRVNFVDGLNYCEDQLLLTKILSKGNVKIAYLPKAFYHYIMTPNSLTRNLSKSKFINVTRFNAMLPSILPDEPRFHQVIKKNALNEFVLGFTNEVYDKSEIKAKFKSVRKLAYTTFGLRWKLGAFAIDLGLYPLAHKLIKF